MCWCTEHQLPVDGLRTSPAPRCLPLRYISGQAAGASSGPARVHITSAYSVRTVLLYIVRNGSLWGSLFLVDIEEGKLCRRSAGEY